jgi:hypothetical protein
MWQLKKNKNSLETKKYIYKITNNIKIILKKILCEVRTRVIGSRKFPKIKENLVLCSLWNLLEIYSLEA